MSQDLTKFIFALPLFVIGCIWFGMATFRPRRIGLVGMALFSFVLQFCTGPITGMGGGRTPQTNEAITMAWLGIYAFWAGILVLSSIWKPPLQQVDFADGLEGKNTGGILSNLTAASIKAGTVPIVLAYVFLTVSRAHVLARFGVGLSARGTAETMLSLPYYASIMNSLNAALGAAFVYLAVTRIMYGSRHRVLYALIIGFECTRAFLDARRQLFILLLLIVLAMLVKHGKAKVRHVVVGVIGLVLLAKLAFPMFYFIRWEWYNNPQAPVSSWVANAWQQTVAAMSSEATSEREQYGKNLEARLNALYWNYSLAETVRNGTPFLYGRAMVNSVTNIIPRAFFPGKIQTVMGDDNFVDFNMGYPLGDEISNLPAFGYADLGLPGCFFYGMLLVTCFRISETLLKRMFVWSPVAGVMSVGSIISGAALQMEITTSALLLALREGVIVFVFAWLLKNIFARRGAAPVLPAEPAYEAQGMT